MDMERIKSNLLVVDDIRDWRITIRGILQDLGYDVAVAGSIDEALLYLETNDCELAISDLRLDETEENNVDGLRLAEIIKARWANMKVVIVTGYGSPETVRKALEPNAQGKTLVNDYLPKQDTDILAETIQRVLRK